jgi:hypothetical protein
LPIRRAANQHDGAFRALAERIEYLNGSDSLDRHGSVEKAAGE